jgi:hypothetical protein
MKLMMQTLLWLASPEKIDLTAANTIDLVHNEIICPAEDQQSILETTLFDAQFFDILESSYKAHLRQAIITFGVEQDAIDLEAPLSLTSMSTLKTRTLRRRRRSPSS